MVGFYIFIAIATLILDIILMVKLYPDNLRPEGYVIYWLIWIGAILLSEIPLIGFISYSM